MQEVDHVVSFAGAVWGLSFCVSFCVLEIMLGGGSSRLARSHTYTYKTAEQEALCLGQHPGFCDGEMKHAEPENDDAIVGRVRTRKYYN